MQVTVEKLSPVLVEFQVEVPAARVRSEVEKAYADMQRRAKVKGFRPGKAPRQVLAHLYGGAIHADVAQRLVDATLNQALAEKQIQPLSQPAIAPDVLRPDDAFSYKARFEVRPEIDSVRWEGFDVRRPPTQPTEAMIDAELGNLRREHSTLQAPQPERAAQKGDIVAISFSLSIDGKLQEPANQDVDAEIGSGQLFKEIEDALVGVKPGDEKDVTVRFSERHTRTELRGKDGSFHIAAKDVKERVFPAIDDELAKDCGQESLDQLKKFLHDKIEKELQQKASDQVAEQLVVELCRANPIPVPPSLLEQQAQATERELVTAARRQGQRLDTTPELRARVQADAEIKVRAGLLMAEIAKAQQIRISDADIEKGYQELAEQTGKNVAKVKAEYREPKKRDMLVAMILEDKILDMLEAAAKVTEAGPSEGGPPKTEG